VVVIVHHPSSLPRVTSARSVIEEKIIDNKNASLPPSKRIPKTPLKTASTPYVLMVICRHHVKVNEEDEALLAFQQGYAKTFLKGDDYDLTFPGAEIDYK